MLNPKSLVIWDELRFEILLPQPPTVQGSQVCALMPGLIFYFETGFYAARAGLELSSCLSLLGTWDCGLVPLAQVLINCLLTWPLLDVSL